jgi:serine protease Do
MHFLMSITIQNKKKENKMKLISNYIMILSISLLPLGYSSIAENNGVESLKKIGRAFTSVAKKVSPAVVYIKVEKDLASPGYRKNIPKTWPNIRSRRFTFGQGSGFLVSKDGYILTNSHVVENADHIKVRLNDGNEIEAKIIGTDPKSEVAVIKIPGKDLPFIEMGDSEKLEIGEWVIAVGNPFGLSKSITAGIVSAKGRNSVGLADYENFIQTDAAINPGNSGGPLIDLDAKVIGINTAIFSQNGGNMGIGFAIPINMAKSIMEQLIANGKVTRGFLGILMQEVNPELAERFELKTKKGVLISRVIPDSPADKSGLKIGDIIIKLEDKSVSDINAFRNSIAMLTPGTEKEITVNRDGKNTAITVKIGINNLGRK